MTYSEFYNKYGINFAMDSHRPGRISYNKVLDDMYCSLTREQAVQMVKDYYDHADEIFNTATNYIAQ